ncbi:MAG: phosphoribosylglycinamide formyltransferase [Fermentimonas sp.]|jgi:phosphoribosylglycinamide formyltransferase-1
MTSIAIFSSGNGSNAENIAKYFSDNEDIRVSLIISNKKDAFVHDRAKRLGIPSYTFNKSEFDEASLILDTLKEYKIDFIVLAGFLLKVSEPILNAYNKRIVNIHPSLLPKHGGKGMYGDRVHTAVKNSKDTKTGITIHYVNENYDEGDIIFQKMVDVLPDDTIEEIANKVHTLEYKFYPEVIEALLKKNSKR